MKKTETYWLLVQAAFCVFAGSFLAILHHGMAVSIQACLEGFRPPPITTWTLDFWYWPYLIAFLAASGALGAVILTDRHRILLQLAFALTVVSSLLMLMTVWGYTAPFSHPFVFESFREAWTERNVAEPANAANRR